MNPVLKGYVRLTRPANLPTAAADILAGVALSGVFLNTPEVEIQFFRIGYLVIASVLLYAGGVVLNDVFDYKLDLQERPERPIPSGLVPLKAAAIFGGLLLIFGIVFAFLVHNISGFIAFLLAVSILAYDGYFKKYAFFGPLNMGLCRSLNLLLGMSVLGSVDSIWFAAVPLAYIFAITLISRGEVHGNNKNHIIWAGILYAMVVFGVVGVIRYTSGQLLWSFPFLGLFVFLIYRPLGKAYRLNSPGNIKKAVISGVLSLIVLDASLAVGFAPWWYGLFIILLLPLSMLLSKIFAVT